MILAHEPNGDSFAVIKNIWVPLDLLAVAVEFNLLFWSQSPYDTIDVLIHVLPVTVDEEVKDAKGAIYFGIDLLEHSDLLL